MRPRKSTVSASVWSFQSERVTTKLTASGHATKIHKDSSKSLGYVVLGIERGSGFEINLDLSIADAKLLVERLQTAIAATDEAPCDRGPNACWECSRSTTKESTP